MLLTENLSLTLKSTLATDKSHFLKILWQYGDIQSNLGPITTVLCDNSNYCDSVHMDPATLNQSSIKAVSWEYPQCDTFNLTNMYLFDRVHLIPNRVIPVLVQSSPNQNNTEQPKSKRTITLTKSQGKYTHNQQ